MFNFKTPGRLIRSKKFAPPHGGNSEKRGITLAPQFTLSIATLPIPVWSSFDMGELSVYSRIQKVLTKFGLSKRCLIMYNPFTDFRLKEWVRQNSQMYTLNFLGSVHTTALSTHELQAFCDPVNSLAPLAKGVYFFIFNEDYIEFGQTNKYIIFDTREKNWNEETIREFLLNFSKELKDYTYKIPDPAAFDSVVLPDEVLGDLKADLGGFLQSKQMYTEELGLPWRRGIMLFGLPGNGKTMLIRKTCEYFGLDHIDMDSLIDQSGTLQLDRAVRERDSIDGELYPEDQRPMVCVLEDIDKYTSFQSGEAEKDVGKISLHALLKGLDGVDEVSGIILFATTNFPDLLHEAIAGRPGRFDKIYEIKKPTPEGIIKLLNYHKISIVDGNLDQIVKELKGSSMAFVAEFIKSAKMKYKRNDLKTEEAKTLLDAIHHHQELCRKHFQEEKTLGFGK